MKQGGCPLCAEVRYHENCERASIVNVSLHPTKGMRKLPTKATRRGRIQRALLCLQGWELYGA